VRSVFFARTRAIDKKPAAQTLLKLLKLTDRNRQWLLAGGQSFRIDQDIMNWFKKLFGGKKDEGIVTLADANYFPGLELLYRSVQESYPVPLACFDIGLSEAQKAIAREHYPYLRILPIPDSPIIRTIQNTLGKAVPLAKPNKRIWPLWICPFLIAAAPFRRVFWLDCDIAVLRNLDGLFALLDQGPVFTPENNAPEATPNKPELYDLLPITRAFDPLLPAVNAGVSGWDLLRDKVVLEAYMYPIRQACEDSRIREAIAWHDQGALIWAIQKTGLEQRVVDSWQWNLCVRHTALAQQAPPWNPDFLDNLRRAVPQANLLHWNGFPVPWSA
jgi:hypothetical protein